MHVSRIAVLGVSMGVTGVLLCAAPAARADDARSANAVAAARRTAIEVLEDANARAPQRSYLLQLGELYDACAFAGDARDVRLAILYFERFLEGEGQTPTRAEVEARLFRLRGWKSRMRAEPQPEPVAQVPLHVLSHASNHTYEVVAGGKTCLTPCTLSLPPGPTSLTATGAGDIKLQLVIPPRAAQIRLQHSSGDGYYVGAALVPIGILVGASMWTLAFACPDNGSSGACTVANLVTWPIVGAGALIAGIALLAGGHQTPGPDENRVEILGRSSPVQLTAFGLAPLMGDRAGASGALRFSF